MKQHKFRFINNGPVATGAMKIGMWCPMTSITYINMSLLLFKDILLASEAIKTSKFSLLLYLRCGLEHRIQLHSKVWSYWALKRSHLLPLLRLKICAHCLQSPLRGSCLIGL